MQNYHPVYLHMLAFYCRENRKHFSGYYNQCMMYVFSERIVDPQQHPIEDNYHSGTSE